MVTKAKNRFSTTLCPYLNENGMYYAREYRYEAVNGALYRIIDFPSGERQYIVNVKTRYSPVHHVMELHFANCELN
jgi:hypothetical protein